MSLKLELQKLILQKGYVSIGFIEEYCKEKRYKLSNAERRLRPSESPMIESVSEKGYIIGYRPKNATYPIQHHQVFSPTLPPTFKSEVEKTNQLF